MALPRSNYTKIYYRMMKCKSNLQPYPIYTTVLTGKNLPPHVGYRLKIPGRVFELLENQVREERPPDAMKEKLIQTMYRESEAQTDPFVVDLMEETDKGLEILTLGWLSWNKGLPAGMNEINTIERARQKRAWESALPVPFDESSRMIRATIVEAMEINEWNYREELIAAVGSLRMELAEKLMKGRCWENKIKYEKRLSKYVKEKKEEKSKEIQKLRVSFSREIRKLISGKQKVNAKYHRWNIIKQFTEKTSELYAPLMRFGEDPRHWHEKISPKCGYSRVFRKLEIMHQVTSDLPQTLKSAFDFNKQAKPRAVTKELCTRLTKWTEENLEKLHEELRNIRRRRHLPQRQCYLKKKVDRQEAELETPFVTGVPDEEEEMFQACLLLQKTIKGRAIQTVMFEGRVKCQELIEELKSTHALQNNMEDVKAEMRRRVYGQQRQAEIEQIQERRKNEILCALEGKTTGDMLDFLAKELLRLQDERKTHAMALAADQERHRREAAEAGRRQVEEQRRREHDEMFKQIMKVHQNIVQALLEDFMVQNRRWLAHREAREYITEVAKKIDEVASETAKMPEFAQASCDLKEEEIIADLIHNFALPEAEKRIVRERLNNRQRNYLRICHDEVYSNIEKVVRGTRNKDGNLLPLPMVVKHKIPPPVRVKYLHLKRMHDSSSSSLSSANSVMLEQFTKEDKKQEQQESSKTDQVQQKPSTDKGLWSSGFSRQKVVLEGDSAKIEA